MARLTATRALPLALAATAASALELVAAAQPKDLNGV